MDNRMTVFVSWEDPLHEQGRSIVPHVALWAKGSTPKRIEQARAYVATLYMGTVHFGTSRTTLDDIRNQLNEARGLLGASR